MKKVIILVAFGFLLCMQPMDLFAKTICFAGGGGASGQFLFLSGGKPDLTPFSGNWILGNGATVPAWGAMIIDASGNTQLSWCSPFTPAATSASFCASVSGLSTLSMSGKYDNFQDGSFDGSLTLTEISCSSIPSALQNDLVAGAQGSPSKNEKQ
jgi:hypothetical protein